MTPDEVRKVERYLSPKERAELYALIEADMASVPWRALPGPQSQAFDCEADIVGYGGAAGGGKTDLLAGLTLTKHKRCLIVRREKAQTEGVVQRLTEILGSTDGYNSQKGIWRLPQGSLLEVAGLDNEGDERRWQGRPHDLKCVAAGTLVWMADGERTPIENVRVGDMVDTLAGPRRVTRTMQSTRHAVLVVTPYGEQIQGATHELLTPAGWVAPGCEAFQCRTGVASPREPRCVCRCGESCGLTCATRPSSLAIQPEDLLPLQALPPNPGGRPTWLVSLSDTASTLLGSVRAAWSGTPLALVLRVLSHHARQVQPRLARTSEVSACSDSSCACGDFGAHEQSSPGGCFARCLRGFRRGGEQLLPSEGGGPPTPHQSGGAGPQTRTCLLVGGPHTAPTHSPHTWSYAHPYSKETRQTDRQVRVASFDVTDAGSLPLFDLTVDGENHYMTGPGFINRNCFDEATEMREHQVRFIMGWMRTNEVGLRSRVLLTFNPPTTSEGRWVIEFFAPWLDKKHPKPAKPGELRWFTTIKGKDLEVANGREFVLIDGAPCYEFDPDDYKPEDIVVPKSRTFIPARLTDNPYYMASGYMSTLQALPEPLRSQMLYGDFNAGVTDDPWQVIPTAWVEEAQARWKPRARKGEMLTQGVDVARGGKDNSVISNKHAPLTTDEGPWFDELEPRTFPGAETPNGPALAGLIIAHRRDLAPVLIDVIGVGAAPYDVLNGMEVQVHGINMSAGVDYRDKSGMLSFLNTRSWLWWNMREALDPANDTGIALPPEKALLSELCMPKWSVSGKTIKVESREEIVKRLGRSPDRATAVILANMDMPKIGVLRAAGVRHEVLNYDPTANMR